MIGSIVTGSGNSRRVHSLPRDRHGRNTVSRILKDALFPTKGAFHKALRAGKRRAAEYLNQQQELPATA
ncbi:hypothetical protein [Novosphingobium sp. LASN5T]|uniref:hypothetical protein n=1 Tax=Novosphingobium sp. LASN5T TaxID=2491021 RepID=UPI000F5FC767|nr:hypothetical protein [Novosphingobium sp. LASN5T]RQW44672.1 hypothetical protein EH199_08035 [Novosphingobium sp. LASN5T]